MSFMLLLTAAIAHEDEDHRIFELYANFDISHLIRPGMNWYALLDIRQQLRRPSLAFYVDKVQYKTKIALRCASVSACASPSLFLRLASLSFNPSSFLHASTV